MRSYSHETRHIRITKISYLKGKRKHIEENISKLPVAVVGISLGFITLGNIWGSLGATWIREFANLFAMGAVILMILKILLHGNQVLGEIKHSVTGSFYPTLAMTMIVFSGYIVERLGLSVGRCIWFIGIGIFIVLVIIFLRERIRDFKWAPFLPI